ncbi:MAG: glycosylase, partial [Planctomycetia bacterium]
MQRTHDFAIAVAFWLAAWCVAGAARADDPRHMDALFPSELVEFGPASRDPLLAGGGPGAWDRDLRERGWIMREGDCWHLWYTGSNPELDPGRMAVRRLGYATSADGLNWTRSAANPLVKDAWVEDVCVMKQGGCYRMFAEGEQDIAHLLTSVDRVHWRRHGPLDIRMKDGRPIPAGPRGTPAVWFERGVWHLYYERMDRGVWLATSRDLETFTNVSDEPVIACGPEPYDAQKIAVDQILRYGGRTYAYYHACALEQGGEWSTCLATSDDLVH